MAEQNTPTGLEHDLPIAQLAPKIPQLHHVFCMGLRGFPELCMFYASFQGFCRFPCLAGPVIVSLKKIAKERRKTLTTFVRAVPYERARIQEQPIQVNTHLLSRLPHYRPLVRMTINGNGVINRFHTA